MRWNNNYCKIIRRPPQLLVDKWRITDTFRPIFWTAGRCSGIFLFRFVTECRHLGQQCMMWVYLWWWIILAISVRTPSSFSARCCWKVMTGWCWCDEWTVACCVLLSAWTEANIFIQINNSYVLLLVTTTSISWSGDKPGTVQVLAQITTIIKHNNVRFYSFQYFLFY